MAKSKPVYLIKGKADTAKSLEARAQFVRGFGVEHRGHYDPSDFILYIALVLCFNPLRLFRKSATDTWREQLDLYFKTFSQNSAININV